MERKVNASPTYARFGALIQQVAESQQPIIVDRRGKLPIVILSIAEYERLRTFQGREGWRDSLKQVVRVGDKIKARQRR